MRAGTRQHRKVRRRKQHVWPFAPHELAQLGVDIVTLGQYLRPTRRHEPVHRYLTPEAFRALERTALGLGFRAVYAGVFVRSSFNAEEVYRGGAH